MESRFKAALAGCITVVWMVTVLAGVATGDYLGAQIVSPVMLLTAGYYFGTELVERLRRNGPA